MAPGGSLFLRLGNPRLPCRPSRGAGVHNYDKQVNSDIFFKDVFWGNAIQWP